ncbi:MAG: sigma 54-interacting transcriptional regulator, partial [Candidatus Binataceae bacterium]
LQAKLLRVLEDRKLRRLGGSAEVAIDVRVLAASNRNLENALREGKFREDLYYRLNVFSIELPSLAERAEDIPALVEHLLREIDMPAEKNIAGVEGDCLEVLKNYRWPGNVRQLRNVIERALIIAQGPLITVADLPADLKRTGATSANLELKLGMSLDEVERELILRTIDYAGGNKSRAAEILGVSLKTLYNRLERYHAKDAPTAV